MDDDALVLVDGRIWTGRGETVSALAIRDGRVVGAGETAEIRSEYQGFPEVDLGGRTVVPGLVDGHNHVVRGGADWARGIDLSGCGSAEEFLAAVNAAVTAAGPGEWVAAIGGWHPSALGGWAPTRELLDQIAPDNPVFLQAMYEFAVANRAAYALVPGVSPDEDGRVYGTPGYNAFLAAMKTPSLEEQVRGTAAMYADFAAAGLTGVHDPGGLGMSVGSYDALREVARFGCHDFEGLTSFEITDEAAAGLTSITRAVARAGRPMQIHGVLDRSITRILDCWEAVNEEVPVTGLRFALAHCDRISTGNIARLARLGAGALVDDRQAFRAGASRARWGAGSLDEVPPLGDLRAAGVPLGAGTDATRASGWNPWRSLHWLVTGASLDGGSVREARHRLSRPAALTAYTHGSAWFSFEESTRGRLAPGYLADLAVLDRDYFNVPSEEIPEIRSELTLVGGSVTHSSGTVL